MSDLSNPGYEGLAARLVESNRNVAPAQNPEVLNLSTRCISNESLEECIRIASESGTTVELRPRVVKLLCHWRPMREEYFKDGNVVEKDSDATFICKDGSIVAHRIVLATASKFFADLFAEEVERRTIVTVPDMTCETMKAVFEVIYTGRLTATLDKIKEVASLLAMFGMGTGRFELTLEPPASDSALMPPPQSARQVSGNLPNPIFCLLGNLWCMAGFLKEKEPASDVICKRIQQRRERGVPFPGRALRNKKHNEKGATHGSKCAAGQSGGSQGGPKYEN